MVMRLFKIMYYVIYSKLRLLINKAIRKNRSEEEVYELTSWLLGYSEEEINNCLNGEISYGDFFIKLKF